MGYDAHSLLDDELRKQSSNIVQVVPNSHFFTDLSQIIVHYNHSPETLTREYLITGFKNSLDRGYQLKQVSGDMNPKHYIVFHSIESIIEFVRRPYFEMKYLLEIIGTTINIGMNLELTKTFKINVGNIPEENIEEYLKKVVDKFKAEPLIHFSGHELKDYDIFIPTRTMERKEIYNRIDGERDYQDNLWSKKRMEIGTPDSQKPVAEWLIYIENHLAKAKNCVYNLDTEGATAELRKVAALAVKAMEIHGCPERPVGIGDLNSGGVGMSIETPTHKLEVKECCKKDCGCKNSNQNDGCCGITMD